MREPASVRRSSLPIYLAGLLMPYVTVGLGLHIFHNAWAAILGYHAGILLLLWRADFASRHPFHVTGKPWWLVFALLGGLAGLALVFLWPHVFVAPSLEGTLVRWGLTSASWPWFIAYGGLVNPWLEELYWRGWLGNDTRSPVGEDAAFAGFHLVVLAPFISIFWLVAVFLILTVTGWLWRQVTRREQSLLPAALCHLVADVSILVVIVSEVT